MKRLLLIACLFLAPSVWAQGGRYDGVASGPRGPVPNALIAVCTQPANTTTQPCSPLATVYTDSTDTTACTGTLQPPPAGSGGAASSCSNPMLADALGNFHFYTSSTIKFTVQIYGPSVSTPYVLIDQSIQGGASIGNYISVPQTGQSGAVQLGPEWFPGTATGLVAAPSRTLGSSPGYWNTVAPPNASTSTIASGTYYGCVTYVNLNGETPCSPVGSIVIGSSNNLWMQATAPDYNWLTGAFAMRVYVGTSAGGPFYKQALASRVLNLGTCTYNAGPPVTVTCDTSTVRHGLVDADVITIAGNTQGSINAQQTVLSVSEPTSGNSTFTFAYGGAVFATGTGGTASFYTGIQGSFNDGYTCYIEVVAGSGCVLNALVFSGSTPPVSNTATIDGLQVAYNKCLTITGGNTFSSANGSVLLPTAIYNLTTPLILGWTAVRGTAPDYGAGNGEYPIIQDNGWAQDDHLGVVMAMFAKITLEKLTIQTQGSGSKSPAAFWAGHGDFTNGDNGVKLRNCYIAQNNASSLSEAIRLETIGITFGWELRDCVFGSAGGTSFYASRSTVSYLDIYGGRLNASGHTPVKVRAGAIDGATDGGLAGGIPGVNIYIRGNWAMESAISPYFDLVGGALHMYDQSNISDTRTLPGAGAAYLYGLDYWSQGGNGFAGLAFFDIHGSQAGGSGSNSVGIQMAANAPYAGSIMLINSNAPIGANAWLDANHQVPGIIGYSDMLGGSSNWSCDIGSTLLGNTKGIINWPTTGSAFPAPNCIGAGDYLTNQNATRNVLSGGVTFFGPQSGGANVQRSFVPPIVGGGGNTWSWWSGDRGTATNKEWDWSPHHHYFYDSNGAYLFEMNGAAAADQVNLCNPGGPANSSVNIGCNIKLTSVPTITGAATWAGQITFTANNGLILNEGALPAAGAGTDTLGADSTAHCLKSSYNNGTNYCLTQTIASSTASMTTAAIAAGTCGTTVTVAATGAATTDTITWAYNAAPAANPAELVISAWPTSGNVNFQYCNPSAGSITPNAATLNWRVVR